MSVLAKDNIGFGAGKGPYGILARQYNNRPKMGGNVPELPPIWVEVGTIVTAAVAIISPFLIVDDWSFLTNLLLQDDQSSAKPRLFLA